MPKNKIETDEEKTQREYKQRMEYSDGDLQIMTPEEIAEMSEYLPSDDEDDAEA